MDHTSTQTSLNTSTKRLQTARETSISSKQSQSTTGISVLQFRQDPAKRTCRTLLKMGSPKILRSCIVSTTTTDTHTRGNTLMSPSTIFIRDSYFRQKRRSQSICTKTGHPTIMSKLRDSHLEVRIRERS